MGTFFERPTRNPDNGTLTADEVQLEKGGVPAPTEGAISLAFDYVKARPLETLLLSFLSALTGGLGNGGCNIPSDLGDLGDDSTSYDYEPSSYQNDDLNFDFGSWLGDTFTLNAGDLAGAIGAVELGVIAGVLFFVVLISLVLYALNTAIEGGSMIFWLRLIRGQEAELNHIGGVKKFYIPLLITHIIVAVGVVFGFVMLIVPGVIMALGWSFVGIVIVDKNLGYVEAIKASWRLTYGYKLDLFIFFILLWLLNLVGLLACCVGIIVTHAISTGALIIVYDRLAAPGNAYMDAPGGYKEVFE